MKMRYKLLLTVAVALVLVLGFYVVSKNITKYTGFSISTNKESFEDCLVSKGITLYINTPEVSKSTENLKIAEYLKDINVFNCLRNKDACDYNNINVFPTWIFRDTRMTGDISVDQLKEFSGC
jgi:hypothetical protein